MLVVAILAGFLLAPVEGMEAQTLRGGAASLDRQNHQARLHDFSYLRTPTEVARMVELGYLVPVAPHESLDLHNVSFPYARPEVRVFLDRLSAQYRAACGEKLVVTSLTRPISNQPRNASSRSVHPTGMAVDLRRSGNSRCLSWLESTLLALEAHGVIEAIYERNPPHYHLAVYPEPYIQYVAEITGNTRVVEQLAEGPAVELDWVQHTVRRGETLTLIASRYGASVTRIQAENGVRGSRINVGQVLRIPVYETVPTTGAGATRVAESQAQPTGVDPIRAEQEPEPAEGPGTSVSPADAAGGETIDAADADAPVEGVARPGNRDVAAVAAAPDNGAAADPTSMAGSGDSPPNGTPIVHRVARGESLWTISRRYGVSEVDVRRANGITGNRILAGQELRIPNGSGTAGAPSTGPLLHEVRSGESLWAIANLHGTSVGALQAANGIRSGRIHPGQVLEVPTGR